MRRIPGYIRALRTHILNLNKIFSENGFVKTIACSEYVADELKKEPPGSVVVVNNFIDQTKFVSKSELRVKNRVLALPRKNIDDIKAVIKLVDGIGYEFVFADGLSEADLINEYHKADIFLASGYPEGFGLPPLEAMACGAVVVGFTGGGANEFMIHKKTSLVATDGDVESVAEYLIQLLNNDELKESIRKQGINISSKYIEERTAEQLDGFFKTLNKELI